MNMDETFALLERTAVAGERCPLNSPFGPVDSTTITMLARRGRIKVEVYRHNWRVVTLLEGAHKGKRTKECPAGGKPYRVVSHDTVYLDPTPTERRRPGPSAPRDFSAPYGLRDLKKRPR